MNNAIGSEMNRMRVKKRYASMYLLTDPTGKSKPGTSLKLSKGHHLRIVGGSAKTFWGSVMSCNHDVYLGHCDVDGAKDRIRVYELFYLLLFVNQLIDAHHEVVFLLTLLIFYPAAVKIQAESDSNLYPALLSQVMWSYYLYSPEGAAMHRLFELAQKRSAKLSLEKMCSTLMSLLETIKQRIETYHPDSWTKSDCERNAPESAMIITIEMQRQWVASMGQEDLDDSEKTARAQEDRDEAEYADKFSFFQVFGTYPHHLFSAAQKVSKKLEDSYGFKGTWGTSLSAEDVHELMDKCYKALAKFDVNITGDGIIHGVYSEVIGASGTREIGNNDSCLEDGRCVSYPAVSSE